MSRASSDLVFISFPGEEAETKREKERKKDKDEDGDGDEDSDTPEPDSERIARPSSVQRQVPLGAKPGLGERLLG